MERVPSGASSYPGLARLLWPLSTGSVCERELMQFIRLIAINLKALSSPNSTPQRVMGLADALRAHTGLALGVLMAYMKARWGMLSHPSSSTQTLYLLLGGWPSTCSVGKGSSC